MAKTIHIIIDIDDTSARSTITCPYCDRQKKIPNQQLCNGDRSLRITCICQCVFTLVTNRRRFERRAVSFIGDLSNLSNGMHVSQTIDHHHRHVALGQRHRILHARH